MTTDTDTLETALAAALADAAALRDAIGEARVALSPPQFAAQWRLATAFGHHWGGCLGEALPPDARAPVDGAPAELGPDPHPYAGVPAPPCGCAHWTPALIEALALATPTCVGGGITGPGRSHTTATGRVRWEVDARGGVSIAIYRPGGTDAPREGVCVLWMQATEGTVWIGDAIGELAARHVDAAATVVAALLPGGYDAAVAALAVAAAGHSGAAGERLRAALAGAVDARAALAAAPEAEVPR